jgi:hypothetical protein
VNFAEVDTNNDGNIDKKEFNAACAGHGEKPTVTAARPSSVWLPTEVGAGRGLCRGTWSRTAIRPRRGSRLRDYPYYFLQRLAGFGVIAIVIARAAMLVPIPPITDSLSGSVVAQAIGSEGPEPMATPFVWTLRPARLCLFVAVLYVTGRECWIPLTA